MSKASVAQEPSMDEILASIRRIIETGEERGEAAPRLPDAAEPGRPTVSRASVFDRFEGRGEYPAASFPAVQTVHRLDEVPESADEPDAASVGEDRLAAELELELASDWSESASDEVADEAPAEPQPDAAPNFDRPTQPEDDVAMSDLPSANRFASDAHSVDEPSLPEHQTFQPANTDRRTEHDDAAYHGGTTLPLTSEATGSLVAASFNDLAQAIRNGELRSIEAMAQDMLRPMLQEWLDDNLPRMVERLVREEIERMSRGGARR